MYIGSKKFISADGGIARMVWMPKKLKDMLADVIAERAKEAGLEGLLDKIADETVATTEEEVLAYITEKNHPALALAPMF
jgi:acetyl-CoA synthase